MAEARNQANGTTSEPTDLGAGNILHQKLYIFLGDIQSYEKLDESTSHHMLLFADHTAHKTNQSRGRFELSIFRNRPGYPYRPRIAF